jgi:hypothetical protein
VVFFFFLENIFEWIFKIQIFLKFFSTFFNFISASLNHHIIKNSRIQYKKITHPNEPLKPKSIIDMAVDLIASQCT